MQPVEQEIQVVIDEVGKLLTGGVDERIGKGLGRILQAARNAERAMRSTSTRKTESKSRTQSANTFAAEPSSSPTYAIERRGGDDFLEERRRDRQPFRANRQLYCAVVEALADADKPLDFEDLAKRVRHALGRKDLAAYLPRTVLRWWLSLDPSPIIRAHSEYQRRGTPEEFRKMADQAWRTLAE